MNSRVEGPRPDSLLAVNEVAGGRLKLKEVMLTATGRGRGKDAAANGAGGRVVGVRMQKAELLAAAVRSRRPGC
ncbi:unnamed protein product [Pieris macdunnoughi]|uniref:Uncharacterized protein n=1 Tax=Pieris macdunnoughi TaxID=345717 RepID=A0A821S9Y4_9NEOP|nr:unnamed protein product [Pieris macdunnoughi]